MRTKTLRKIMCLLVVFLLVAEIASSFGVDSSRIFAQELSEDRDTQENQLDIELMRIIIEEFNATEDFIDAELSSGISINEIYDLFKFAEIEGKSYWEVKELIYTKEKNLSLEDDSEINNSLLPPELKDIVFITAPNMTSEMLEEIANNESNEIEDIEEEVNTTDEDEHPEDTLEEIEENVETEPTEETSEETEENVEAEPTEETSEETEENVETEPTEETSEETEESIDDEKQEISDIEDDHSVQPEQDQVEQNNENNNLEEANDNEDDTSEILLPDESKESSDATEDTNEITEKLHDLDKENQETFSFAVPTSVEFDMQEPTFNIHSFEQAPYLATSENEKISPLSGALGLSSTDVVMPGINGLNFALTRIYNSDSAQQYDLSTKAVLNQEYAYHVYANYTKKLITNKYVAKYRTYYYLEYDYDKNGIGDYTSITMNDFNDKVIGNYTSFSSAQTALNNFKLSANSKTETAYETNSSNSFKATKNYSDSSGYSGTLSKSGSSYVISGSYTSAASKNATSSCINTIPGKYNSSGQWVQTDPATNPCPDSKSYSSDGFSGKLSRTGTVTNKACTSPGTPNYTCTKKYTANYSGTVTKPAVDTRVYEQKYSGTVSISKIGEFRPGIWSSQNGYNVRVVDAIESKWIDAEEEIASAGTNVVRTGVYDDESIAQAMKNYLNAMARAYVETIEENGKKYALFVADKPNAAYTFEPIENAYYYTYYNSTKMSDDERLYPIGKGWSWDLPFMKIEGGKQYVHLQGGGTYEVSGTSLKGYEWEGLSLQKDTTQVVDNVKSSYRLSNVQGTWNQYFASDGRLIRVSDAYDNYIDFTYEQDTYYNRMLISKITNNIGNEISIQYAPTSVIIQYNNSNITYNKTVEEGIELLSSVVDTGGRQTLYNYALKNASFNLIADKPSRAMNNPYALLTGIVYPTGAATEYNYETTPISRYIGKSSVNQYFRMASRRDKIAFDNATSSYYNQYNYSYGDSDMGSSYSDDTTITTEVATSDMISVFTHKKDYVDSKVGNKYYLMEEKNVADQTEELVIYQYDKKVANNSYVTTTPTSITSLNTRTNDPLTQKFSYNDYGNITQKVDERGLVSNYTYHAATQLLASETVPSHKEDTNIYTTYVYNDKGTMLQQTMTFNNVSGALIKKQENQEIDENGNVGSVVLTDSESTLTYSMQYNNGFLSKISSNSHDTNVIESLYTYDQATGNILEYVDGNGNKTSLQYDSLGRIVTINYPDETSVSAIYDDVENTVTTIDALNNQSITKWNGLGWEKEKGIVAQNGYQKIINYGHSNYGQVEWSRDALNAMTSYKYDPWGRGIETVAPNGSAQLIEYDDGNRLVITKNRSSTGMIKDGITQVYDRFGRVTETRENNYEDNTETKIQSNVYQLQSDQVLTSIDAEGNETNYLYDALGNVIEVINALGESVKYQYNSNNLLTKIMYDNGTFVQKEYDSLGRLIKSTDQKGIERIYQYDSNHNLILQTDNKIQVFTYQYDEMNQLLEKQGPTDRITFSYNANGQRLSMLDSTGLTEYAYMPYTGNLAAVTVPDGKQISYEYNAALQLISKTLPFGDIVNYEYDEIGRLEQLKWNQQEAERYVYDDFGQLSERKQANGVATSYATTSGVLTELTQAIDEELINLYQYKHDQNKNITEIIREIANDASTHTFTYDDLNRISTTSAYAEEYSYDEVSNRSSLNTTKYIHYTNAEYEYDEWDRLTKVNTDGKVVEYRYNGDNLLVERKEDGLTTRYYYDGDHIIAEGIVDNGAVTEKASYLVNDQIILREDQNNSKSYYMFNGHGDVTEIRDEQGTIQNKYDYDLWGNVIASQEIVDHLFLYSGEYWDSDTQLQYLRARWYDPSVGRFISKDTYEGQIDNPLTLNLYAYVHNNPLRYIDPTGHYCVSANGEWAHAGTCSSKDSIYLGDDKHFDEAPIIENGVFKRYLNKDGPYREKEMNFWSHSAGELGLAISKSLAEEGINSLTGKAIHDKLVSQKSYYKEFSINGVYQKIPAYKTANILEKGLAKSIKGVGFATILMTGYSIYEDTQSYSGWELGKAITLDVGGTALTVGVAVALTAAGAPVLVVVGVGVLGGIGINAVIDYVKTEFLVENKKK